MATYRRLAGASARHWSIRHVPVCSSTEELLGTWLRDQPSLMGPRAVIATHQRRGVGQWGRAWVSPPGGVWISAALPWKSPASGQAGLLGLALALSLVQRLERRGLSVQIKWPNDLLVDGAKLAGLLPRLVYRGSTLRLVRFGLGLNVRNAVPAMATSLRRLQGPAAGSPAGWAAQVMVAMDRCLAWARADQLSRCLSAAEARLWNDVWIDPRDGQVWSIEGLSPDGGLCLRRGATRRCLQRWG